MTDPSAGNVRVWDLPTRMFHWTLAVAAVGLVVTAKVGGAAMVWHGRLGYAVGTLILFRLIWGFAGGYWSRFASFPPSLPALLRYMRGANASPPPGHSPLGALSVYALLVFFLAQVSSGLFADDGVEFSGPLGVRVSNATIKLFTWYHKNIGQFVLIALMVLHIAAVLYYLWGRRRNLITPMITGDAPASAGTPVSRDDGQSRTKALLILAVCSAVMWTIVNLGD